MKSDNNGLVVYGTSWCPDCWRTRRFLENNAVDFQWIDIDGDEDSEKYVRELNRGKRVVPTILFPDGSTLSEPSDAGLANKLGLES